MLININKIILFGIVITPIFYVFELYSLLYFNIVGKLQSPIFIKLLKDFIFITLVSLSFVFILRRRFIRKEIAFIYFIFLFIFLLTVISFENIFMYLSGIRWLLPFLLGILLVDFIKIDLLKKLAYILAVLFIFSFVLQLYELFSMADFYGYPRFGIFSARTTGFFTYPTGTGFFIILVWFFNYFYGQDNLRNIILYLTPLSLIMAYSKTAILCFLIIILVIKFYKNIVFLLFSSVVTFILMLNFFYFYNKDAILISLQTRIDLLIDNVYNSDFILGSFGQSTLAYDIISRSLNISHKVIPSDSLVAALPVNLGLVLAILFVLVYIVLLIISIKKRHLDFTVFLVIYGLFSFTLSFTEVFPMNLLFSVLLAYYLTQMKRNTNEI